MDAFPAEFNLAALRAKAEKEKKQREAAELRLKTYTLIEKAFRDGAPYVHLGMSDGSSTDVQSMIMSELDARFGDQIGTWGSDGFVPFRAFFPGYHPDIEYVFIVGTIGDAVRAHNEFLKDEMMRRQRLL